MDNIIPTSSQPGIAIDTDTVINEGVVLSGFMDSIFVRGKIATDDTKPAILTQGFTNAIKIDPQATVQSDDTAIQIEGISTAVSNLGIIEGGFNGINLANDDTASALIVNFEGGVIASDSRAINIGGVGGRVFNQGKIISTSSPRNGTVYGDVTAQNVFIDNAKSGLIDVGKGNDGDAVSLELGAEVNGAVRNYGLIKGRGMPGVVNEDNQAAAVRLYWVEAAGSDVSIFNGNIENSGGLLAENGAALVIEDKVKFNGDIINKGLIETANPENGIGINLENGSEITGEIFNSGEINGGFTGVNFDNGGEVSGSLINTGAITSTSRAINIGGSDIKVVNKGKIITTADPRNGVVYSDQTANNFDILNEGLIDVGEGNNGDAIALQLGAEVEGSISNTGLVRGRGLPDGAPDNQTNQAAAIRLYWGNDSGSDVALFDGDIINEGTLAAENGAAIIIEDRVQFDGKIINAGKIQGGITGDNKLAIDASKAESSIAVRNTGLIQGDVLLSAGDDLFDGRKGTVEGIVAGGAGDDTLTGGHNDDILVGNVGNDVLQGLGGHDTFRFGSDLLDGVKDIDLIKDFAAEDTFDFSKYLEAGGFLDFSLGKGELTIDLNHEDSILVRGDLDAAQQQLIALNSEF